MKKEIKIIKYKQAEHERLDIFLAKTLKTSRSQIKKLIDNGLIFVNKIPANQSSSFLKNYDEISIHPAKKIIPVKPVEIEKKKAEKSSPVKINIIADAKDYLVVEKPTGLLTHPTEKHETNALSEILKKKYPSLKKVGEDPLRPGIVHRLDKDASGLLVVAKNNKMFFHLKEQFKNRTVEKEYIVLVHGKTPKDFDKIDFPIARGKNIERMAALPHTQVKEGDGSKTALTEFDVEKYFVNFTLLRVKIHTGRMHQIRVHMLAYNHPVVGDNLYFHKKQKARWDKECGRLFLHCTKLVFNDLKGDKKEFISPLPSNLKSFLTKLR